MPTLLGANARMRIITMNYAVDNLAAYLIASIVARYASLERTSNRNAIGIVPVPQDIQYTHHHLHLHFHSPSRLGSYA